MILFLLTTTLFRIRNYRIVSNCNGNEGLPLISTQAVGDLPARPAVLVSAVLLGCWLEHRKVRYFVPLMVLPMVLPIVPLMVLPMVLQMVPLSVLPMALSLADCWANR